MNDIAYQQHNDKRPNTPLHNNLQTLATRLLETAVIGCIVLYGVIKVMQTQVDIVISNQHALTSELRKTTNEQSRRTVMVEDSFKKAHTH